MKRFLFLSLLLPSLGFSAGLASFDFNGFPSGCVFSDYSISFSGIGTVSGTDWTYINSYDFNIAYCYNSLVSTVSGYVELESGARYSVKDDITWDYTPGGPMFHLYASNFDLDSVAVFDVNNTVNTYIDDFSITIDGVTKTASRAELPYTFGSVEGGYHDVSVSGTMPPEGFSFNEAEPFTWSGYYDFQNGVLTVDRNACYPEGFIPYEAPFPIEFCTDLHGDGSVWYRRVGSLGGSYTGTYYCVYNQQSYPDAVLSSNYTLSSSYDADGDYSGSLIFIVDGWPLPDGWGVELQHTWTLDPANWYGMSAGWAVMEGSHYFSNVFTNDPSVIGVSNPSGCRVYISWGWDDVRKYRFVLKGPNCVYPVCSYDSGDPLSGGEFFTVIPLPTPEELNELDDFWTIVPVQPDDSGNPYSLPNNDYFGGDGDYVIDLPDEDIIDPGAPSTPTQPDDDTTLPPTDPSDTSEYLLGQIANNTYKTYGSLYDANNYLYGSLYESYKHSGYLSAIYNQDIYAGQQLNSIASILQNTDNDNVADSEALQSIKGSALTSAQYDAVISQYVQMMQTDTGELKNGFLEWKAGNDSWIVESRGYSEDEAAFLARISAASEGFDASIANLYDQSLLSESAQSSFRNSLLNDTTSLNSGFIDFSGTMATHQVYEREQWTTENQKLDALLADDKLRTAAMNQAKTIISEMNDRHASDSTRDSQYQVAQQAWAATVLGEFDTLEAAFEAQGVILTDTSADVADMLIKVSDLNSTAGDSLVQLERQSAAAETGNQIASNTYQQVSEQTAQLEQANTSLSNLVNKSYSISNVVNNEITVTNATDLTTVENLLESIRDKLSSDSTSDPFSFDPDMDGPGSPTTPTASQELFETVTDTLSQGSGLIGFVKGWISSFWTLQLPDSVGQTPQVEISFGSGRLAGASSLTVGVQGGMPSAIRNFMSSCIWIWGVFASLGIVHRTFGG